MPSHVEPKAALQALLDAPTPATLAAHYADDFTLTTPILLVKGTSDASNLMRLIASTASAKFDITTLYENEHGCVLDTMTTWTPKAPAPLKYVLPRSYTYREVHILMYAEPSTPVSSSTIPSRRIVKHEIQIPLVSFIESLPLLSTVYNLLRSVPSSAAGYLISPMPKPAPEVQERGRRDERQAARERGSSFGSSASYMTTMTSWDRMVVPDVEVVKRRSWFGF
ncbi:hypothetical protein BC832DRAFT_364763 [Gaertneriomyces semiglobifer]|nr:hypothetical protein BC832DRAFT_364763 [Gaertneriomyces semiglobifer]